MAIFVSPTGDDGNAGTRDRPVQTLQKARDLARGHKTTVYLAGGAYRMEGALVLKGADSGVEYRAMAGEHPVISGGARVTGWTLFDKARNIWSAAAPAGMVVARQLYVDGVRAERARGAMPGAAAMAGWGNARDIEFVYAGGVRCPVATISGAGAVMAEPCWSKVKAAVAAPVYIENAFELLGAAGEWYLDRVPGVFYYVPRAGEDLAKADVEAPMLETLVRGDGTAADPVHDVVFRGIQFSFATWLRPSTGEGYPGGVARANVSLKYARKVRFVGDSFVHSGGSGLELGEGCEGNVVERNVFGDLAGDAVTAGRGNRVRRNRVGEVRKDYGAPVATPRSGSGR